MCTKSNVYYIYLWYPLICGWRHSRLFFLTPEKPGWISLKFICLDILLGKPAIRKWQPQLSLICVLCQQVELRGTLVWTWSCHEGIMEKVGLYPKCLSNPLVKSSKLMAIVATSYDCALHKFMICCVKKYRRLPTYMQVMFPSTVRIREIEYSGEYHLKRPVNPLSTKLC